MPFLGDQYGDSRPITPFLHSLQPTVCGSCLFVRGLAGQKVGKEIEPFFGELCGSREDVQLQSPIGLRPSDGENQLPGGVNSDRGESRRVSSTKRSLWLRIARFNKVRLIVVGISSVGLERERFTESTSRPVREELSGSEERGVAWPLHNSLPRKSSFSSRPRSSSSGGMAIRACFPIVDCGRSASVLRKRATQRCWD